jgi:hypothetical protein
MLPTTDLSSLQSLKKELQGQNGLLDRVRKSFIPSGEDLSKEAWQRVSFAKETLTKKKVKEKFNNLLCELVDTEYQLYLQYEQKCISEGVLKFALTKEAKDDFPTVHRIVKETLEKLRRKSITPAQKLTAVGSQLRTFYKVVEQSFSQSRMTRAGGSSQYHLQALLEIAGFKSQFQKQQTLNGTVDFLFPSRDVWERDRRRCVVVSMKRTLRERYKQVFEELKRTGGLTVYLLVTETYQEALRDITVPKVDKLNKENIYLVVRDEIKEKRFSQKSNVISFSAFVNEELPNRQKQWLPLLHGQK